MIRKKRFQRIVIIVMLFSALSLSFAQGKGVKKKRAPAHDYGNIVMNNLSEKNNIAPAVFNHWLHRTKYTCRLCHVDLGFSMKAGETEIRERDNRKGLYCGACHDGKEAFGFVKNSPSGEEIKLCDRCHFFGKEVKLEFDFYKETEGLPRERFGNGINWEQAERDKLIKLKDELPGITIKRKPLDIPKDYDIAAKVGGLPGISFSHKKHAVWSGCELCHPDIFGIRNGKTNYTMEDIFAGKFCGLCHGTVAFPNIDCQRCHTKPVN